MINFKREVFIIVGISVLLLPMVSAYFDTKLISVIPVMLLIFIALYLFLTSNKKILVPRFLIWPLALAIIASIISSLLEKISHLGLILVMLQALLTYYIFQYYKNIEVKKIYNYLKIIYIGILIISIIDWAFILTRNQVYLVSLFNAESVTKYKNYNSATLLQFITNNGGYTGANGPTLGSQGLSQLLLCGIIFFNPYFNKNLNLIFIVLVIVYLLSASMTTSIFIFFILLLFLFKFMKNNFSYKKIIILFIIFYFIEDLLSIVFFRLNKFEDIFEYYDAYFRFDELINIDISSLLFGMEYGNNYTGSDFGYLSIILSGGVLYFLFFLYFQIFVCFLGYKCYMFIKVFEVQNDKSILDWAVLGFLSSLASLMFFWGLIHYTASIELGGTQLYSLCIALTCTAYVKIYNFKNRFL
jgi:hypothetical protein